MFQMYILHHVTAPMDIGGITVAFRREHAFSALPAYIQKFCCTEDTSRMTVECVEVIGDKIADNTGIFEVMYMYEDGPWQYAYYTHITDAAMWVVDTTSMGGYRVGGITEIQVYGD